jgi:hypothetical protein
VVFEMARSVKTGVAAAFASTTPKKSGTAAVVIGVALFVLFVILIYVSGAGGQTVANSHSSYFAPAPHPVDLFPLLFVVLSVSFLAFFAFAWRFASRPY